MTKSELIEDVSRAVEMMWKDSEVIVEAIFEKFTRRGLALVSVAESLDTGSAAGRLVFNIMTAVSQWEREAIGERTRDAMSQWRASGQHPVRLRFSVVLIPCNMLARTTAN